MQRHHSILSAERAGDRNAPGLATRGCDNRGFLLSEQLPELGVSGDGTVTYSNFDPRGHALRRYDGLNRLRYEIDRAERLSKVRECDGSWQDVRILRQLDYATANNGSDKANGKLYQATANTLISPDTFPVVETYTYAGVGGRVSRRRGGRVSHRRTGVDGRTIDLDLIWSDLGKPCVTAYPDDSGIGDPFG